MEPVSLLELNESGIKDFLSSFNHVFSDCDGVIWETNNAFPGAGKFFELMKRLGKTINFVSNNSLRSRENYEAKFKSADIEDGFIKDDETYAAIMSFSSSSAGGMDGITPQHLKDLVGVTAGDAGKALLSDITRLCNFMLSGEERLTIPSTAIASFLQSVNFNKTVYCVACPETIVVLESHGFKCKEGPDVGTYYYGDYIEYLTDDEEIGAVVFDSDFKVNLPKLYKAITYLNRPEVIFINGATDKYVPLKAGVLTLGTGIFTEIASQESKREPILLGKPGKTFGEFAIKRAGVSDPSRVLFIGDMIEQDVGLGRATGFKTLLVLTNKTKEEMLSHETLKPDYYADSLGSIVPILEPMAK